MLGVRGLGFFGDWGKFLIAKKVGKIYTSKIVLLKRAYGRFEKAKGQRPRVKGRSKTKGQRLECRWGL